MAVNVYPIQNNPTWPYQTSETYIPDQLIAGNLKLVTDTVTIGGAAALARGSVLGQIGEGTVTGAPGKTFGTGTIVVATVPTAGDTVTIGGTVITFVAANPSGNQVLIGGPGLDGNPVATPTTAGTALALAAFLIASTDANLLKFNYSVSGSTVTLNANLVGTAGNALTLATSHVAAFTLSAATLAGGTDNTGAQTIGTISAGTRIKPGRYVVVQTSATAANVIDPLGDIIGQATVGVQFTNADLSFLITTGSGIAAGDQFVLQAAAGSGAYVLATAAATDGSAVPRAVLADAADPTGGAVLAPVYLMGEFNTNVMTFGAGITPAMAAAALRGFSIFLKNSVVATDPS